MQPKYTCYVFKSIHRFIIGLFLLTPVEEKECRGTKSIPRQYKPLDLKVI